MRSESATRLTRVSVAVAAVAALALPMAVVGTASADSPVPETVEGAAVDQPKQRTIVTTDGEIDDLESFVRYLYYANEVETEGIVLSSSRFHWSGNGDDIPPHQWEGEEWPLEYIDDYEAIYPNLIQHADGYPTPDELRNLYKVGNITNVGEMEEDTEGSDLIKEAILKNDPRTLFIQIWGGPNTTARALKSIEDEYAGTAGWDELQAEISDKVVLYNILDQDPTLQEYIRPNWPDIKVIDNLDQFWSVGYWWRTRVPADAMEAFNGNFVGPNIINDHGPLASRYIGFGDGKDLDMGDSRVNAITDPANMAGFEEQFGGTITQYDFISEGDSPSFMQLWDFNGLRNSEDPSWGGWGGRFDPKDSGWEDASDFNPELGELDHNYPQARWIADLQNDFAARADWGIAESYEDANHNPQAAVAQGVDLDVQAGQALTLNGIVTDPDGDSVTLEWWDYAEAGSYPGDAIELDQDGGDVSFEIPADAEPGETIHLILEATDSGTPALKHYQRVVLTVTEEIETVKPRVIAMTDGEIDDWSTMVRFLMYASDYDIAGIVETNSQFQPVGHSPENWLEDQLDAYEEVYPNLLVHNPDYPSPDYLRSVSVVGNETTADLILPPDEMTTRDTDGERLIIDRLLDDDPRPILIGAWGGANTLAQALWTIKTEHSQADWDRAVEKTRVYAIWYQDNGGRWIEENMPEIQIFEAFRWDMAWNYRVLEGPAPDDVKELMDTEWLYENIKTGHGPLGEFYPQEYTSEGDTPAFLGAVNNGLAEGYDYADFTLGGWAGRAELDKPYLLPNHYTDRYNVADDGDAHKQYWRWLPAVQNDWAARADWMVSENYEDANHQPVVVATGPTRTVAQAGEEFTLDLRESTDPDGDELSFTFWHYGDQDSVETDVEISHDGSGLATFVVPDEPGTQIQIIGEVTDDGEPSLTTYQRYLIDIGTEYAPTPAERPADSIDWSTPEAITDDSDVVTDGELVRAVNLTTTAAQPATTVNGVTFQPSPYVEGTTTVGGTDTMYATDSAPLSGSLDRVLAGASDVLGGSDLEPFAALSEDYRALLGTGFYNDADESTPHSFTRLGNFSIPERYTERAGYDLTLADLTVGQEYEIQLFVNDYSTQRLGYGPNPDLTTIIRDQGGQTELRHNGGRDGTGGQFVTGRFTATEDTKVVQFIGGPGKGGTDQRSAVVNAYQLRTVDSGSEPTPEPTPDPTVTDDPTDGSSPAPTPAADDGRLPSTGASVLGLLAVMATLVVAGGATWLVRRRTIS